MTRDVDKLRKRLAEAADDSFAVIATTPDGTILFWSPGARRLYGWTEAEARGRNVVDLTPAVQSRGEAGEIMDGLRRGEAWRGEIVLRTKRGALLRAFVADFALAAGDDPTGVIVGVSAPVDGEADVVAAAETLRRTLAP